MRKKLIVVYFLENNKNNKCETVKGFDIQSKQIYNWSKNKEKLLAIALYIIKFYPNRSVKYPSLENDLFA